MKVSLETKVKEIIFLTREVRDLKDQNEKIKISLEARDKERDDLKDKIRELKNELKSFKCSSDVFQREWQDAKKALEKSEENYNKLKLDVETVEENSENDGGGQTKRRRIQEMEKGIPGKYATIAVLWKKPVFA